ncbi:transglycosylase [Methylophaga sp. 42_25_T18]|nr:transglycosylase [Methylophaga sp. 42_25_T18]OUR89244.1 transglycosylase [Methylophaga sp. 42_8_T64]
MAIVKTILSFILTLTLLGSAVAADNKELQNQRALYQQAHKALQTNQVTRFKTLLNQLDTYPLKPYLEYLYLRHRLNRLPEKDITQFLFDQQGTFFAARLRNSWLNSLARKKQWQQFLVHYQEPQSVARQCLRLQALISTGNQNQALAEVTPLWLVPRSQDKACDPIFKIWQQQGRLTDELRWQRIQLALNENQFSLAKYLAKKMSNSNEAMAWITRWQKIHHHPNALLKQLPTKSTSKPKVSLSQDTAISREIIKHGITRLARKSTDKAFETWQRIKPAYQFSEQDKLHVQRYIANRAALNREDRTLEYFADIPAEPWRVRSALWQQDWQAALQAILSLNIDEQKSTRWQYWLGRSQAALGQLQTANDTLQALVTERDFYGFLAADRLKLPYQMNHNPIPFEQAELITFSQRPAIARLREFYALNLRLESRRQVYALKQRLSPRELQLLATLTHRWGWHNQTIAVLGKARYWDALDLRFPILFDSAILKAGKSNGIDPSWLFGIARQESAFNPQARSHVGAMGLMQIMPNTGKLIAKLINRPLKKTQELLNPDRNIQLGSAYLKRMYDQNQNNPVLATASYNAGPHRVKNWLPKQELAADIWIENIPFNETRKYTSNVLAYAAVFDYQRKQTITPITTRMPAVQAKTP